jgi:hypothetical protein
MLARLTRPAPLALLGMLWASGVAVYGWFETSFNLSFSCTGKPLHGENILHGIALAFFSGLAGLAVIAGLFVIVLANLERPRLWLRLVGAVCVLEAAALGLAIAFVALDSATYVQQNANCGFLGPSTGSEAGRASDLYYLWAIAIAILLVQAVRLARHKPLEPSPKRTSDDA